MKLRSVSVRLAAASLALALVSPVVAAVSTVSANFSLNHAGSISTGSVSLLGSSSNATAATPAVVSLPQFNPASGTLNSVTVAVTTNASTNAVTRTGLASLLTAANLTSTLGVNLSAGSVTRSAQDSAVVSGGTLLSLLGLTGAQPTTGANLNTSFTITDPVELMAFIGTGSFNTTLSNSDTFNISTIASLLNGVGITSAGNYSGKVDLTYNYTPAVVGTAPTIVTAPAPLTLSVGNAATFTVVAGGTAPFTYQWSKNGVAISGATSSLLVVASTSLLDAGVYTVTVSNSVGSVTSSSALLTVNAASVVTAITSQPLPQTAVVGSSVTFSVGAAGSGSLTYQWRKDGNAISGAVNPTYTISSVQTADAGTYSVVVTGLLGPVTSAGATLAVTTPGVGSAPSITSQPTPLTLSAGGTITLSVGASGTGPFTYQWFKNSGPISGATASTLTIANATIADSGLYSATVSNAGGSTASAPAAVVVLAAPTVNTAPTVSTQPLSQVVASGSSVTFSVSAIGTAPFTYQWRKDGVAVSGATSASLALANAQATSSGSYTVVITNPFGSATSLAAQLTVQVGGSTGGGGSGGGLTGAPTISVAPQSQNAIVGMNVTFTVVASGTGPLTYQWLKDGSALLGANSTAFTLSNVQPSDSSNYSVIVQNLLGAVVSDSATLTVQGTATIAAKAAARLVNLSTRSMVGTGADVLIGGFVIGGTTSQTLLVRAIGPSLAEFGITGLLADPKLTIYRGDTVVTANDDWAIPADRAVVSQMTTNTGAFGLISGSKDAAVVATLQPGAYTVIVEGAANDSGTALIELYNLSTQQSTALGNDIVNLSSRGRVGSADQVVIAGFVVGGSAPQTMLIRGVGPSLATLGVPGVLSNPMLTIYQGSTVVMRNDDWTVGNDVAAVRRVSKTVGAFPLDENSKDAALLMTLQPGTYTAVISGQDNTQGVALVEIYQAP